MLCITFRDNRRTHESNWHVGEKVPRIQPHKITQIQADGDEAEYINEVMGSGINRAVQYYYGDLARTIYLNLRGE